MRDISSLEELQIAVKEENLSKLDLYDLLSRTNGLSNNNTVLRLFWGWSYLFISIATLSILAWKSFDIGANQVAVAFSQWENLDFLLIPSISLFTLTRIKNEQPEYDRIRTEILSRSDDLPMPKKKSAFWEPVKYAILVSISIPIYLFAAALTALILMEGSFGTSIVILVCSVFYMIFFSGYWTYFIGPKPVRYSVKNSQKSDSSNSDWDNHLFGRPGPNPYD